MEDWWKNTSRGKEKYWEENLYQCQLVHQKFLIDQPGTEPGLLQ
jgi:hypothetical protein